MNIFESHAGVAGQFDPSSTGGMVQSLLSLARDIRVKLGKQGYLLDSYMAQFLEAANAMLAYDAANEGFNRSRELRSLCTDVLGQEVIETDHPLYNRARAVLDAQGFAGQYQEAGTKLHLLYASSFVHLSVEYIRWIVDDCVWSVYNEIAGKVIY